MKYTEVEIPIPTILNSENSPIAKVDDGIYVYKGDTIVMRAHLNVSVKNQGYFRFTIWISVDLAEFTRMMNDKAMSKPFSAEVLSDLPLYGEGKGQIVDATFDLQSNTHRVPIVKFLNSRLQVYEDQINGVSESTYQTWIDKIDSGEVLTSYKEQE